MAPIQRLQLSVQARTATSSLVPAAMVLLSLLVQIHVRGQVQPHPLSDPEFIRANYSKQEVYIPMRDGVRLYTVIYRPKEDGHRYPFLMTRTPYSAGPYGEKAIRGSMGPNRDLMREKYIFVSQDVRGRYMSEGSFEEMTPARDNKTSNSQTDESSDTWDTIDWLLKNIPDNNGRVGIWGISYPGFYASASLPDAHPAIKAVSPQAPVTDEFIGDDANHNGAFYLMDNFSFDNFFDIPRSAPLKSYPGNLFNVDITDAYQFYLKLGSLKNSNNKEYFDNKGKIWNEYLAHSTYDAYWQARNIRTHLRNIRPAVLCVGGWFDAEDLFGALRTYEAIEKQSPGNDNHILMGPWSHGGWAGRESGSFGILDFGQNVNDYYHRIETRFFHYYLKDLDSAGDGHGTVTDTLGLAEATVFETGTNVWKQYSNWPPAEARQVNFYLQEKGGLSREAPARNQGRSYDEYTSDPANPVPYVETAGGDRDNGYMAADQRFAAKRPDVLTYQTDVLQEPVTVTGRLRADIFITSTGTDADIIVKVIDVLPGTDSSAVMGREPAGFQRLVRAEVFRCKFRNSYEKPEALAPGKPAEIGFDLNEIAHTFKAGHRIMVQVQSSWFPLVDRNPQQFVNIPTCRDQDFKKAKIRVLHDPEHPSSIRLPVIN